MKTQAGHLNINLLGTSFELESDQRDEYLQALYGYYISVIEKARSTANVEDPLKLSIVAGLLLSDEVFKARASEQGVSADPDAFLAMEHTAMKIIAKIDDIMHDDV